MECASGDGPEKSSAKRNVYELDLSSFGGVCRDRICAGDETFRRFQPARSRGRVAFHHVSGRLFPLSGDPEDPRRHRLRDLDGTRDRRNGSAGDLLFRCAAVCRKTLLHLPHPLRCRRIEAALSAENAFRVKFPEGKIRLRQMTKNQTCGISNPLRCLRDRKDCASGSSTMHSLTGSQRISRFRRAAIPQRCAMFIACT